MGKMRVKKLEWVYEDGVYHTILGYQCPDNTGSIYRGYEIFETSDDMFWLTFLEDHVGYYFSLSDAQNAAQMHFNKVQKS